MDENELRELMHWAAEVISRRRPDDSPPCCVECGEPMLYRSGNIHEEPKAWGQNWTCPEHCRLDSFRVPLTEDEFTETKAKMGGTNHTPLTSEEAIEEGVTERLKDLGYLSM